MNGKVWRALLAVIAGVILVVIVGVVAFHLGATNGYGEGSWFGPFMRGRMAYGGFGAGLFGLLFMILVVVGVIWLIAAIVGWNQGPRYRPGPPPPPPGAYGPPPAAPFGAPPVPPASPEGLERLKELSDLHDRGALTDEEFTAAKRRLLGL